MTGDQGVDHAAAVAQVQLCAGLLVRQGQREQRGCVGDGEEFGVVGLEPVPASRAHLIEHQQVTEAGLADHDGGHQAGLIQQRAGDSGNSQRPARGFQRAK